MLIEENRLISDATYVLFAIFSRYKGATFQILLYIVTYQYRKSHDTINRLTQKTKYAFFWHTLFICEWNVHMVELKTEDKLNKRSVKTVVCKAKYLGWMS